MSPEVYSSFSPIGTSSRKINDVWTTKDGRSRRVGHSHGVLETALALDCSRPKPKLARMFPAVRLADRRYHAIADERVREEGDLSLVRLWSRPRHLPNGEGLIPARLPLQGSGSARNID